MVLSQGSLGRKGVCGAQGLPVSPTQTPPPQTRPVSGTGSETSSGLGSGSIWVWGVQIYKSLKTHLFSLKNTTFMQSSMFTLLKRQTQSLVF